MENAICLENLVLNSTGFLHQDNHSSMSKAPRDVPLSLIHLFLGFRFSSLVSVDQLGALIQQLNYFWQFFIVKLKKFTAATAEY